jgi:hypothetical protein
MDGMAAYRPKVLVAVGSSIDHPAATTCVDIACHCIGSYPDLDIGAMSIEEACQWALSVSALIVQLLAARG